MPSRCAAGALSHAAEGACRSRGRCRRRRWIRFPLPLLRSKRSWGLARFRTLDRQCRCRHLGRRGGGCGRAAGFWVAAAVNARCCRLRYPQSNQPRASALLVSVTLLLYVLAAEAPPIQRPLGQSVGRVRKLRRPPPAPALKPSLHTHIRRVPLVSAREWHVRQRNLFRAHSHHLHLQRPQRRPPSPCPLPSYVSLRAMYRIL